MYLSIERSRLAAGFAGARFAIAAAMVLAAACARAATLDPAMLPNVESATFEVVQAKPDPDPLAYEKPLPLDLLPYQERTDKYYSIGTAFAIGQGRYVTAGHVLLAGLDSLWGPPALRDSKGNVYPIDKIEKFDLRKDFVVFSLKTQPGGAVLAIDDKPTLNDVVYAVGNALGTGVVIRDGLYTSDTPEEQDGSWKWMRFSAAASPGNSGGPLLDKDGKVIGVVLAKSPNENLNYALPMRQVLDAPENEAVLDERTYYALDVLDGAVQNDVLQAKFALPLGLPDFYRSYDNLMNKHEDAQQKALLTREAGNLFPVGSGSARLLNQVPDNSPAFPTVVVRNSNREWELAESKTEQITLGNNGYVETSLFGHNILVSVLRPDNVNHSAFYHDAKLRMDLIAKTGMFQRSIGSESVKITSLGNPENESEYTDRWQRKWQVDIWSLPFLNTRVVAYTLLRPNGCVVIMRPTSGNPHDALVDLDQISSFMSVNYEGTLTQWKEYLQDFHLLPDALKHMHIDFDYGHSFTYTSPQVSLSIASDVQHISANSIFQLVFTWFPDNGRVNWAPMEVNLLEDRAASNNDNVGVQRYHQPPAGLDDTLTSIWQKVLHSEHPFDATARDENDVMKINAVVSTSGDKASVLYSAYYSVDGDHPQDFMKGKLDLLMKGLQVKEH